MSTFRFALWGLALGGVMGSLVARVAGKDWDEVVVIFRATAAPLWLALAGSLLLAGLSLVLSVLAWRQLRRLRRAAEDVTARTS